jgi:hypothetical protein
VGGLPPTAHALREAQCIVCALYYTKKDSFAARGNCVFRPLSFLP